MRSIDPKQNVEKYSKLNCSVCNQEFIHYDHHHPFRDAHGVTKGWICGPCYESNTSTYQKIYHQGETLAVRLFWVLIGFLLLFLVVGLFAG